MIYSRVWIDKRLNSLFPFLHTSKLIITVDSLNEFSLHAYRCWRVKYASFNVAILKQSILIHIFFFFLKSLYYLQHCTGAFNSNWEITDLINNSLESIVFSVLKLKYSLKYFSSGISSVCIDNIHSRFKGRFIIEYGQLYVPSVSTVIRIRSQIFKCPQLPGSWFQSRPSVRLLNKDGAITLFNEVFFS